jgi:hypothetical protein
MAETRPADRSGTQRWGAASARQDRFSGSWRSTETAAKPGGPRMNLTTRYLGLTLANPFMPGASHWSRSHDTVLQLRRGCLGDRDAPRCSRSRSSRAPLGHDRVAPWARCRPRPRHGFGRNSICARARSLPRATGAHQAPRRRTMIRSERDDGRGWLSSPVINAPRRRWSSTSITSPPTRSEDARSVSAASSTSSRCSRNRSGSIA